MPRLTIEREEATRRRILEAASRVFQARGVREATIADVVRASGLSVGAIYTYFPSKDDLVRESCVLTFDTEMERVLADLSGLPTVRAKLERSVEAWLESVLAPEGLAAFLAEIWAGSVNDPQLREMLRRRRERLVTVATMLLREGMAEGELAADLDPDALAHGYTGMLDGLLLQCLERGGDFRRSEVEGWATAMLDLLLRTGRPQGRHQPAAARSHP